MTLKTSSLPIVALRALSTLALCALVVTPVAALAQAVCRPPAMYNFLPTVSLTSVTTPPGQGLGAPATLILSANADDSDGSIARVDFYQGDTLIGTVTTGPYNFTWTNVSAGTYTLTAKAIDNRNGQTTSTSMEVTVIAQARVTYLHTDHLNTPRVATDANNRVIWRWAPTSEPFGNSAPNEDPDGDAQSFTLNLRMPGQYFDTETGTFYNYYRDYDPSIGRYIQSDPIGLAAGINTYAYVGSNPLSLTDPFGLAESGPYHPPEGVSLRCTQADTCPQIQGKMQVLERMIHSHQGWDWNNPPPRGGGRHATEIAELWRAYARCQAIWGKKCVDCPPEENAFQKWWRSLTDPRPKPVPDPAEELFGQNPRRQIPGAPGRAAGPSTTPPIRILP